jgi:dihydrodipicolinate reductase
MIGRRALLAAMASTAAREADAELPVPPGNTLAFRLLRHGNEIGHHTATFERNGEQLTVRVTVDALVTVVSWKFGRAIACSA